MMPELMFWGFVVRFVTSVAGAAPFILAGYAVAAIFRRFFGYEATRRMFGEGTRWALLRAWVIGMLLPVCSLGAIPVIGELRRAGIRGGTILAFAMSAPLFNPLSLLYGLTLSEPVAILAFAAASLVIVTVAGWIWDRWHPDTAQAAVTQQPVAYGYRRMLAVGTAAAREAAGRSSGFILAGLIGVGLLGAFIPPNSLQRTFNHDVTLAPVYMASMAIPVYATPMLAMAQLGMMFQHANSVGAAFVLLVLGAGLNLGLVAWTFAEYGLKRFVTWLGLVMSVVLALAYGLDQPLFPKDIEPADHTHAFDVYCRPFSSESARGNTLFEATRDKLGRDVSPYEWQALWMLAALTVIGAGLRLADRRERLERWLESAPAGSVAGRGDFVVPGPVLGVLALLGLIAVSIVGCFAYYPPPREALDAMTDARTSALSAALAMNHTETKYWSERYDDWTRKLEVGAYLRYGGLSEYHRWKPRLVREGLELLEHTVEDGKRDKVSKLVARISRAHRRMSRAYLEELDAPEE